MNLPNVIINLLIAQDNFDSHAYVNCFTQTAIIFDEGKTYKGKRAIRKWIEKANQDYKTIMKPLQYIEEKETLKAEILGTFTGSPIILIYQFKIIDGLIESLKITG